MLEMGSKVATIKISHKVYYSVILKGRYGNAPVVYRVARFETAP